MIQGRIPYVKELTWNQEKEWVISNDNELWNDNFRRTIFQSNNFLYFDRVTSKFSVEELWCNRVHVLGIAENWSLVLGTLEQKNIIYRLFSCVLITVLAFWVFRYSSYSLSFTNLTNIHLVSAVL